MKSLCGSISALNINNITPLTYIFVFLFSLNIFSQENPNSIYFELLGNGGLYSINYDRLFTEDFGIRAGIMYMPDFDLLVASFHDLVFIPVTANYLVGRGKSKLEIGAGIIYASISGGDFIGLSFDKGSGIVGTATIGYRYQKPEGGFMFRVGFTPLFSGNGFQPYGGLSIGTSF